MRASAFILCLFWLTTQLLAQTYQVHHFGIDEGLASATVNDMAQDPSGRIWFATRAGISVYDGATWEHFSENDGLSVANTLRIRADERGVIWTVGLIREGDADLIVVSKLDNGSWQSLPPQPLALSDAFGSTTREINLSFDTTSVDGRTAIAVGLLDMGLLVWDGDWTQFSEQEGLSSNVVRAVSGWRGGFYVATDGGLSVVRAGGIDNRLGTRLGAPPGSVIGLSVSEPGDPNATTPTMWLQGADWMGQVVDGELSLTDRPVPVKLDDFHGGTLIEPDHAGGAFYGNPSGLFYVDQTVGTAMPLGLRDGLIADGTTSLLQDREHNVWVASARGVSMISSRRFASFSTQQGLLEDEVSAIVERDSGNLVFGHNRGWTEFDGRTFTAHAFDASSSSMRIMDMVLDADDNVWAAVPGLGVARFDQSGHTTWYATQAPAVSSLTSLAFDSEQRLWVASYEGVWILEQGKLVAVEVEPGQHVAVRRLYRGPGGAMYLASRYRGLYVHQDRSWRRYVHRDRSEANQLYSVVVDREGAIWAGSRLGLLRVVDGELRQARLGDATVERPVYVLTEDTKGRLWVGTDDGVTRWDGVEVRHFTLKDGMIGRETNRAAGLVDRDGRVWIGTDLGVSVYQERFDLIDQPPPLVELGSLEVDGRRHSLESPPAFSHGNDDLIFHFKAITFADESSVYYRARLEGYDEDWLPPFHSLDQQIRYTNLEAGSYVFHIQARRSGGAWSDISSSGSIVVRNPFWKSWWFALASILLVGLAVFTTQRVWVRRRYSVLLEHTVAERTAHLTQFVMNSPNPIFTVDREGHILDWNPASEEAFGYDNKIVGRHYRTLLGDTQEHSIEEMFSRVLANEPQSQVDVCYQARDMSLRHMIARLYPLMNHAGEVQKCVFANTDITARKQAEDEQRRLEENVRQSQKFESLGLLAGGIAHDFNNLLTVILGNCGLALQRLEPSDPAALSIERATRATERAATLTRQMLTFAGGASFDMNPVDLSKQILEITALLNASISKKVELQLELAQELPAVEADVAELQQLVMNLVLNGVEACGERSGFVRVKTGVLRIDQRYEHQFNWLEPPVRGDYVRLEVTDNGCGMDSETKGRIFDPFFSTKFTGRGLGLSALLGIVRGHRGFLRIESALGQGTSFEVLLPVCQRPAVTLGTDAQTEVSGKGVILVVDDEPAVVDLAFETLTGCGYQVLTASDGRQAVKLFEQRSEEIDLVLLDVTMPELSGEETLRAMRIIRPDVVAILTSGYTENGVKSQFHAEGPSGFIQKPYLPHTLAAQVDTVLSARRRVGTHAK